MVTKPLQECRAATGAHAMFLIASIATVAIARGLDGAPEDWNPARGTGCARLNAERMKGGNVSDNHAQRISRYHSSLPSAFCKARLIES